MKPRKALFLDLFGTLVEDHGVLDKVSSLVFKPGALDALSRFAGKRYLLFISVCHDTMPEPDWEYVENLQSYILDQLGTYKIGTDDVHYLNYTKQGKIRKLSRESLLAFAKEFNLDLTRSVVIGDLMKDVKTGQQVGAKTVLLSSSVDSPLFEDVEWIEPDVIVEDLAEAADVLLGHAR